MIKHREQLKSYPRENLRGGNGVLQFTNIFESDEVPKTRLFSVVTVKPGDSIGVHPHDEEGEAYVILDGEATVLEDGVEYLLHAGDAEYCTGGHTHGLRNDSDGPVTFLAIIIN